MAGYRRIKNAIAAIKETNDTHLILIDAFYIKI